MTYVIFDNELKTLYKKPGEFGAARYDTISGCKAAATRLNKKTPINQFVKRYTVTDHETYRRLYPVKMVERINLMSGKPFMEAEDTPNFCSPASEAYWSM